MNRDETIKSIRKALKRRSGKSWSVTGGRGTAWGWITIDAPPARRTWRNRLRPGCLDAPGNYEEFDGHEANSGHMGPSERAELGRLLGFDKPVHFQGESIPASSDYYQEYIDRAEGRKPKVYGKQYWD